MKTIRTIINDADITETNTVKVQRQTQGNYFVMDSEQVVSNPYQDLQAEALDSIKKVSLTERLTSVRNNVCEHNLRTKTQHLNKQEKHSLRNIHMDSSNLRYEAKVMDINKRKNDLMMQKRIEPEKDYSYDARQINNSAKRLGVTNEKSYYLDRDLKYPLRGNIVKDHNAKPFIKKARKTMQERFVQKKIDKSDVERAQTAQTFERATTAQSMSTSVEIPSPEPSTTGHGKKHTRAGSKSAPPPQKSSAEPQRTTSRVSTFDDPDSKLPSIVNGSVATHHRSNKSHVKFLVEEPTPFRQSTPNAIHRSKTYHAGVPRPRPAYSEAWDSDSDDDYAYCDKVDLRALFFGDKSQNADAKSAISGTITPRTIATRMSSVIPPPPYRSKSAPIKQEQLIKETKEIRDKIDKFLGTLPAEEGFKKKDEIKEEKKEEKKEERKERDEVKEAADSASKAAYLLSVFSKPLDRSLMWGGSAYRRENTTETVKSATHSESEDKDDKDEKPKKKNMWEFIKTNIENGNFKKKYSANDLLLQQLTGILVQSDKKTVIPINSASRALRHTPTFKMRRVVEELMRQRTRYEQQEVEKLQAQEENGEIQGSNEEESGIQHYPPQAWATQPQRVPISQETK